MTTIAYRSGELAADSKSSCNDTFVGSVRKIERRQDGALAGVVGTAAYAYGFLKWFMAGEADGEMPDLPRDRDGDPTCEAFIVRPDGEVWKLQGDGWFPTAGQYFAWGSGRDIAIGALYLGASPASAVAAAVKHDAGTGGDIVVLRREA